MITGRFVTLGSDGQVLTIARDTSGILHVSIRRFTDDVLLTVMLSEQDITEALATLGLGSGQPAPSGG